MRLVVPLQFLVRRRCFSISGFIGGDAAENNYILTYIA